jgi:hypothetical protein
MKIILRSREIHAMMWGHGQVYADTPMLRTTLQYVDTPILRNYVKKW